MVTTVDEQFRSFYEANTRDRYYKFIHHLRQQLQGLAFEGKRVLDIGCGKGFVSLWIALNQAPQEVVALDESLGNGAQAGVLDFVRDMAAQFRVKNLRIVESDFFGAALPAASFDIILANNALHHVVPGGNKIRTDATVRKEWVRLFEELRRILRPDGVLVLREISRLSVWRIVPLRLRHIEWDIHPTVSEFMLVARDAGFTQVHHEFLVSYKLRNFRFLFANQLGNMLLDSCFHLYAKKSENDFSFS